MQDENGTLPGPFELDIEFIRKDRGELAIALRQHAELEERIPELRKRIFLAETDLLERIIEDY